jgi:hypothetical protein
MLPSKLTIFFKFLFIFRSSRNQQELENLIKVLITDYIVRKKFPGKIFFSSYFHNTDKSI